MKRLYTYTLQLVIIAIYISFQLCIGQSQNLSLVADQPNLALTNNYQLSETDYYLKYEDINNNISRMFLYDGNEITNINLFSNNASSKFLGEIDDLSIFTKKSQDGEYVNIDIYNGTSYESIDLGNVHSSLDYLATFNGKVHFVGRTLFVNSTVYSYDGNTLTQQELPDLLTGPRFYFSEALNQILFIIGGFDTDSQLVSFNGDNFEVIENPTDQLAQNIYIDFQGSLVVAYAEDVINPEADFLYVYNGSDISIIEPVPNEKLFNIIGYNETYFFASYIDLNTSVRSLYGLNNGELIAIDDDVNLSIYDYATQVNNTMYFSAQDLTTGESDLYTYENGTYTKILGPQDHDFGYYVFNINGTLINTYSENSIAKLATYSLGDAEFNLLPNTPAGYEFNRPERFNEEYVFLVFSAIDNDSLLDRLYSYDGSELIELEFPDGYEIGSHIFNIESSSYFVGVSNNPFDLKLFRLGDNLTINELELNDLKTVVYPNPFDSNFNIKFNTDILIDDGNLTIYSLDGKLVDQLDFKISKNTDFITYDSSKLSNGTYLLHILTNSFSKIIKIIK